LQPFVSIIITAFNQEQFIEEAILSVLNQTYTNWELIIIDDGSQDKTALVCELYVKKDSRIKYLYQKNSGVAAARNLGFLNSVGEFIQFLDGDDYLSEDKVFRQIEFLTSNPDFDICYCNFVHYFQATKNYIPSNHIVVNEYPLEDFLFRWDRSVGTTIHSALFKKNIWGLNELPFPTEYKHRYEDWVFWVLIALKQKKVGYLDFIGAYYRIHHSNFTSSTQLAFPQHFFYAMFYLYDKLPVKYKDQFVENNTEFIVNKFANEKLAAAQKSSFNGKIKNIFRRILNRIHLLKK
jgi:glycosyltransferase involved in cell wall biosynthesis